MPFKPLTYAVLSTLLMSQPSIAQTWREVQIGQSEVSISLPQARHSKGVLRSMPKVKQGQVIEGFQGVTKYAVGLTELPKGTSLARLAREFLKNEVAFQKRFPKESDNPIIRNAKISVTASPIKSATFQGRKTVDFSINIEVFTPSFGYGTRARWDPMQQLDIRMVEVNGSLVVMQTHQLMAPLSSRVSSRFFQTLRLPKVAAAVVEDKPHTSAKAELSGTGSWKAQQPISIRVTGHDGWSVQNSAEQPGSAQVDNDPVHVISGLRAERRLKSSRATLSMELHQPGDLAFDELVERQAEAAAKSGSPDELQEALVRRDIVWRYGRRCWQVDIDQIGLKELRTMRRVYVPLERHVVAFVWSTDSPEDLAQIDGWTESMIRLGVPAEASKTNPTGAKSVLNWFEDYAIHSRELRKMNQRLNDAILVRSRILRKAHQTSGEREPFEKLVAAANRKQQEVTALHGKRTRLQMTLLKREADRVDRKALRNYFPVLANELSSTLQVAK